MDDKRQNTRIDSEKRCHLLWSDSFYPAIIKNVSLGGALLFFDKPIPDVHSGGVCYVHLDVDHSLSHHCTYASKVIRVFNSGIALRFTGLNESPTSYTRSNSASEA